MQYQPYQHTRAFTERMRDLDQLRGLKGSHMTETRVEGYEVPWLMTWVIGGCSYCCRRIEWCSLTNKRGVMICFMGNVYIYPPAGAISESTFPTLDNGTILLLCSMIDEAEISINKLLTFVRIFTRKSDMIQPVPATTRRG